MQASQSQRSALLVVDMQVGLFQGPEKPHDGVRVLAAINQLLDQAHQAGAPVFAARHTGPVGSPIEAGSPFWQLLPELRVDPSQDKLFDKTRPSCFFNTGLGEWLDDAGVTRLVIVGLKTQYCIDTTCRLAADMGFQAVLVADAHTCMDTPVLTAEAIIAHHNATLAGPFVTLANAVNVKF